MKHIVYRIVAGLVLIATIAGIAFFAFNAGTAYNAANLQVQASTPAAGQTMPYAYGYGMPFGFHRAFLGFGCFGALIPLFLVCLAFGAFRRMLWGPRFGWHRMHHGYRSMGNWGEHGKGEGFPPMMAEMHRRMHAAEENKSDDPATQK